MIELLFAVTDHFLDGDFNERHLGLRYENNGYMGSLYRNSEGNASIALGFVGRTDPVDLGFFDVAAFGEMGGATGYSGGPIVPFVRIGVEYHENTRIFLAPAMNTDGDFGVVVGFEYVMMRF